MAPAAVVAVAAALPTASMAASPVASPSVTPSSLAAVASVVSDPAVAATQADIVTAVRHSPLTAQVPASYYSVLDVRVSSADPRFASAQLVPTTDRIGQAVAVLRHEAGGWKVLQVGSAQIGCGVVPPAAQVELNLVCPI